MDDPTPDPETSATPARRRRPAWQHAARASSFALGALAAVGALAGAAVASMWGSEDGTRWLLAHVPGVTAVDVQGSFGAGALRIGSLRVVAGGTQVDLRGLALSGLRVRWHPRDGTWVGIALDGLEADAAAVRTAPAPGKAAAAAAPTSLRSPVALEVSRLRVGALAVNDAPPLRDLSAAVSLGADDGALHRVDHLAFAWERVQAQGTLRAQADAPLRIDVSLEAHDATSAPDAPAARPAVHWSASATANGPLAGFELAARLRGDALPGRTPPQAQLAAHVTPFAALPVGAVALQTTELDLSALSARLPATRLQGSARVATTKPAALDVDLRNLAPAAWSAGGLPVASLSARLEVPWDGKWIAIPSLRVALADEHGGGGELRASGRWEGGHAQAQLDLDQVQPARLDARLGAWRVGGMLRADVDGLPAPAAWRDGTAAKRAKSADAASAASPASAPADAGPFDAAVAHVTGRLSGSAPPLGPAGRAVAPPPMALQVDALLRADALQLKQFALQAGPARLSAQAAIARNAAGRWQGDAHAQWTQLDPGAWWRLAESGPLRTGANLLNGEFALQLVDAPAAWDGLAAVRGKLQLTLADSRLAGVPLNGRAGLDALRLPWTLDAELHNAGNQARAEGSISPGRADAAALATIDRFKLSVDAPSLESFAPFAPAAVTAEGAASGAARTAAASAPQRPASGVAATIPGQLIGKATATVATGGRSTDARAIAPALAPSAAGAPPHAASASAGTPWPTRGSARLELEVTGARIGLADPARDLARARTAGALKIASHGEFSDWSGPGVRLAKLEWRLDAGSDERAPLEAALSLVDGQWGAARIARADAALSGTLAEHHLQAHADAPISPPEWLAHLADVGDANATRLDLRLDGRWRPEARDAPAWEGRVAQLDVRAIGPARAASGAAAAASSAASSPPGATPGPAWFHLQPLDLALSRDAAGDWQTLRVAAGHADVAGLGLDWQPSSWTAPAAPGAQAHWTLDAALAPFSVAKLLARAQPDLGWHGDLQMAAKLHAAFDGRWHVDARLARTAGDLSVSELAQDPADASRALGLTQAVATVQAEGARWQADADVAGTRLGELSGRWIVESPSPAALPTPDSPLQGQLRARVADLNVWGAWLPPGWRLGGEMQTDLALSGRWGAPHLTGQLTAGRLSVRNALEGVYAHDGDLEIRLAGDQARVERLRLLGGNGELTASGDARLGAAPAARLQLRASQFQLLGRIDRKLVASGDVGLQLSADAIKVDGRLGVDEGLFDISKGGAPTLDSDVQVLDGSAPDADDAAAAPVAPRTGRATAIALDLNLGDKLHLKGRGIDTFLRGDLKISSPNGLLAVRGAVRTNGGQYIAYGQKLQVARGELTFTGPVNDPRLDVLATRPNLDVVVGVAITGTALAPHVRLMSEPEMSDADKLSWLMLGRAPDTLGGADTALLQQAAIALLSGEGESPSDQILNRLGLTDFGVGQQTDANEVKQTVVTLGRQISKRVYVGYERGVNATTGNWQLIYRIAQRLTVRAQSGEDNSADVIYTWRWN